MSNGRKRTATGCGPVDLVAGLEQAARREPARVAVVDPVAILTFEQLLAAVDRRARLLAERCAFGSRIGILLDSSSDLVVTYYACLRAGMVYVPLPPLPKPVLLKIVRDLSLDAVFGDDVDEVQFPVIPTDARPESSNVSLPAVDPSRPAHILLTSGTTTGTPKAVITDQTGSMHSHAWRSKVFDYREDDVVACNIFGIWDVVPALHHDATVFMVPGAAMRDPRALAYTLTRHAVSRIMMTPTLLAACLAVPDAVRALRRLRLVVLCGEIVSSGLVERARRELPGVAVGNLYSIAECHDVAAAVTGGTGNAGLSPAEFADVRVSRVEDRGHTVARGEPGRVLITGPGLALGYVREPVEDSGFFDLKVDDSPPVPAYDTGDLGILHPSGKLELLGRCDERVKIRGQWADLREVATAIACHPGIADAVVTDVIGKLAARVVPLTGSDPVPTAAELRAYLRQRVPAHCVPTRFEFVTALALGATGKADRRPENAAAGTGRFAGLDDAVLDVFREALGDRCLGPDDDFVECGGDSLSAITLVGELQRRTGCSVAMADFYTHCTPARLARFLEGGSEPQQEWRLPVLGPIPVSTGSPREVRTILLTGAGGHVGGAVREACTALGGIEIIALTRGDAIEGVGTVYGDLSLPRLGLAEDIFLALGKRIDAIIHAAAVVDPFAPYARVEPVNVGGTRELIRLACINRASFHHISSSAVFPLGADRTWSEDVFGAGDIERLSAPLAASGAEAYSFSKLAAESLVWQAADRGLPVRVIRVPHVLGHPVHDRLLTTLEALAVAAVFPDGDWMWQFTSAESVSRLVAEGIRKHSKSVVHAAARPVPAAFILDCLRKNGTELQPVSLAALATALDRAIESGPDHASLRVLARLVADHGPRAALSLHDAILVGSTPCEDSPRALFRRMLSGRLASPADRTSA